MHIHRVSQQKPPRGTLINTTHPLARGICAAVIFNEASGAKVWVHGQEQLADIAEASYTSWEQGGLHLDDSGGSGTYPGVTLPDISGVLNPFDTNKQFSMFTRCNFTSASTAGTRYGVVLYHAGGRSYAYLGTTGTFRMATANYMVMFNGGSPGELSEIDMDSPLGQFHSMAIVGHGPSDRRAYANGALSATDTTDLSASTDTLSQTAIGALTNSSSTRWCGAFQIVLLYNRALSAEEIAWLHREPYAMFRSSRTLIVSGAPPSERTVSVEGTLAAITSSSAAKVLVGGSSAATLAAITSVGDTDVLVDSDIAAALAALTSQLDAEVLVTADIIATLSALTASLSVDTSGARIASVVATLSALVASLNTQVKISNEVVATLAALTSSLEVGVLVTSDVIANLAALTSSLETSVIVGIQVGANLAALTSSGVATVLIQESVVAVLEALTSSINVTSLVQGTVVATLSAMTCRVRVNTTGVVLSVGFPILDGGSTQILGG